MANSDLIGSLVRAMEILKMIGNSPSGCRVEEMCAALQLKAPTVYNILRTLSSEEFVERRNGYFCLGREFRRLVSVLPDFVTNEESIFVRRQLTPPLKVNICLYWGRNKQLSDMDKRFLDFIKHYVATEEFKSHFTKNIEK